MESGTEVEASPLAVQHSPAASRFHAHLTAPTAERRRSYLQVNKKEVLDRLLAPLSRFDIFYMLFSF